MKCKRCGGEFDRADLRPPSMILRVLAAPFFLPLLLRSGAVRGEISALYCRPCRRQLNISFLFIAFLVLVFGTIYVLQKLGISGPPVP
ncbi:MAG: hypothetical protein ACYC61_17760 [Isosphaeraceae bacterium]